MKIPYQRLEPETLRNMVEEFVTRDGTDYGWQETDLETKVRQVMAVLAAGKAHILYDEKSEVAEIVVQETGI